jgi:TonB-linked SusC/RagA family outer membrane protein
MRRVLHFKFLLLVLIAGTAWGQTGTVTGKVTSPDGTGLPGVSVVVKGTSIGVITDPDGVYSIQASEGILVFTFIGYKTVEAPINNQTSINIDLEEDVAALEEVVIIGYGTQQKKNLTTAVSTVNQSDFQDRPLVSAAEGLQGKAAGVQVTQNSGKPGNALSIRIRGATSIQAGNEPVYIVDGVQTFDIRGINPSDIESFSILKDAASASIYGSLAANGVVIITTKRGKLGQPKVRFDTYAGFSNIRKTIDVLNTSQYEELMAEIPSVGAIPDNTTNTDWSDLVFGTGVVQNYQLSVSGGDQRTHYLLSGGYLKNEGMIEPSIFDRYTIRLNLDNNVKDWLKVGTSINYLRIKTEDTPDNLSSGRGGVIMSTLNTPPFLKPYKDDGSGEFDTNPFQASWENPYAYMYGPDQEVIEDRFYGNAFSEIYFLKDFTYKASVNFDIGNNMASYYLDPFKTAAGRNTHGSGYANRYNYNQWLVENTLNYAKSFGDHTLGALVGLSSQKRRNDYTSLSGTNFPNNTDVRTLNAANDVTGFSNADEWTLVSLFARVNYDFKSKYLFSATVRRDGSSKLVDKWGTMPSASLGWRISQESFMESVEAINELKLRFSWGRTGNSNGVPSYAKYGLVNYTRVPQPADPDDFNGPAQYQATFGNPNLKWETTDQANIGLDLALLNSRLSITMDAYWKKTDDLILPVNLPSSTGLPPIITNAGAMENKGFEFTASSINIDKELKWNTDFNISFNRNKITQLDIVGVSYYGNIYSNNQPVVIVKPGVPLGTFYGYVSEGVDPATGDIVYKDVNKNGVFDSDGDRTIIGDAQPDFIFGLTNNLTYKRWNLNIFFQGSVGNDIYNATRIDLEGMFDSKNQSTEVLNRWTPDNTDTNIPRANNMDNVKNSTRFIENGSYVRLKAVTLTYNFNPEWLTRAGISRLSIYATGQNLLTFTDYSGFDPEVNAFGQSATELGIDYGTYPQQRTIIFGLNLEF